MLALITACGPAPESNGSTTSNGSIGDSVSTIGSVSMPDSTSGNSTEVPVENISEAALSSIQGAVKFTGEFTLEYPEYDEEITLSSMTVYAEDKYYAIETLDGEIVYEMNAKNHEGIARQVFINEHNVVDESDLAFSDGELVDWAYLTNDIAELTVTDFTKNAAGKFVVTGDAASILVGTVYGYSRELENVELTVVGDKVTKIEFETGLYVDDYDDATLETGEFIVSEHGTAVVEDLLPYATLPEHAALVSAFENLGNNFTINMTDDSDFGLVESNGLVTEDVALMYGVIGYDDNYEDIFGQYGYFTHEAVEGLYAFSVIEEEVELVDFNDEVTMEDVIPNYTGVVAEFFAYEGEGLYVAHASVANFVGVTMYSPLYDNAESATWVSIQLGEDGQIEYISYDYEVDYLFYSITGNMTIEFSDIGKTEIAGVNLEPVFEYVDLVATIPAEMFGSWYVMYEEDGTKFFLGLEINHLGVTLTLVSGIEILSSAFSKVLEVNLETNEITTTLSEGAISYDEGLIWIEELGLDVNPVPGFFFVETNPAEMIGEVLGITFPAISYADAGCFMFTDLSDIDWGLVDIQIMIFVENPETIIAEITEIVNATEGWEYVMEYDGEIYAGYGMNGMYAEWILTYSVVEGGILLKVQ